MHYINPYELLRINAVSLSELNSKTIIKEKKRLLQEIELSDENSIKHNNVELTKSDCLRAIDDLDDKNKREFHFFIFQNKPLNDFLSKGTLSFFENYQFESIYKLTEFLDFISPYFSTQYDKILSENFNKGNINAVSKIILVKPITNEFFSENCYKRTYSIVKNIDDEVYKITKEIDSKQSAFIKNNFSGLDYLLMEMINVALINALPTYFQSLRNQLTQTIRNLAVFINNESSHSYKVAFNIIQTAFSISTDGLVKQNITKDYYIIKGNYEKEENDRQNSITTSKSILSTTNNKELLNDLFLKVEALKYNRISFVSFASWVDSNISMHVLSGGSEISNQIVLAIRLAALEAGNDYSNIDTALRLINKLLLNQSFEETKQKLISDKEFLEKKRRERLVQKPQFANQSTYKTTSKSDINIGAVVFICILFLVIIIAIISNNSDNSNSNNNSNLYNSSDISSDTTMAATDTSATMAPDSSSLIADTSTSAPIEPLNSSQNWQSVSMENGNITGCDDIYFKSDNTIDNRLEISVGFNSDAVVKLINLNTEECIRKVFINKASTYSIRHIPQGQYYLKIAYGNDWEIPKGESKCNGQFMSDAIFKKSDEILDFNFQNGINGIEVPSYKLTLNTLITDGQNDGNNFNTNIISSKDF